MENRFNTFKRAQELSVTYLVSNLVANLCKKINYSVEV